jgi:hypothetical protein
VDKHCTVQVLVSFNVRGPNSCFTVRVEQACRMLILFLIIILFVFKFGRLKFDVVLVFY